MIGSKIVGMARGLVLAYLVTAVLLFVIAVIVYKVGVSDTVLSGMITAAYILATFIGGFVTGKRVKEKKFVWGMVFGLMYILIALGVGAVWGGTGDGVSVSCVTRCIMCVSCGMLGAMLG